MLTSSQLLAESRKKTRRMARLLATKRLALESLAVLWMAGSVWQAACGRWDLMLWGVVSAAAGLAVSALAGGRV